MQEAEGFAEMISNFEFCQLCVLGASAVKFPSSFWSLVYLNTLLRTSLLRSMHGLQRFELLERVERLEQFPEDYESGSDLAISSRLSAITCIPRTLVGF